MMINNIWILIGKKLSEEASEEELRELYELIRQSGQGYPLEVLEQIWVRNAGDSKKSNDELEKKWGALEAKLDLIEAENNNIEESSAPKPRNKLYRIYKVTAWAAVAAIFISVILFALIQRKEDQRITSIIAPQNGISKIQLPDGSKVWLNSGSKLTYKNNYDSKCREVSLLGEAFFDVVKDPSHPFIVQTTTIKIKVLGTAFNVRSYANDITSEATLLRGRIELTILKNPDRQYILKPSEKMTIDNSPLSEEKPITTDLKPAKEEIPAVALSKMHQSEGAVLPSEALWMEDIIAFDNTDFDEIAKKMERKYNLAIVFKDEKTSKLKFTGKFKNESIEKALKALQSTAYFHFKITDNRVLIY